MPHILFALMFFTVQGGGTVIGYFDNVDQCWQQARAVQQQVNQLNSSALCVTVNYKR